jgi:hypothetical protein
VFTFLSISLQPKYVSIFTPELQRGDDGRHVKALLNGATVKESPKNAVGKSRDGETE